MGAEARIQESRRYKRDAALAALAALFARPGSWMQGAEAEGMVQVGQFPSEADELPPTHPDAVCWCLTGGIIRVCDSRHGQLYEDVAGAVAWAVERHYGPDLDGTLEHTELLVGWNDQSRRSASDIREVVGVALIAPLE